MKKKRCCSTCLFGRWVNETTFCYDRAPSDEIKPNQCGLFLFSAEQANKLSCGQYYEPYGNPKYKAMDFDMWLKANHPEIMTQYNAYTEMMEARMKSKHEYRLRYEYPDAHGLIGDYEQTFTDKDEAIAAAVEASKDKVNYNISIRHSWWDNLYEREEGEWIEWEKEAKK
jgi:hypothetical protein